MRAEVGLLSRNIVVMGEMEGRCYEYSNKLCSFFDFDTFGGHIKVGLERSLCTFLLPATPSHTKEARTQEEKKSLTSATEKTASPHATADPPHCCCLSFGFEVHLTPLQTLLSQPGWCSTDVRYSLHIPIPVFPRFWRCSA